MDKDAVESFDIGIVDSSDEGSDATSESDIPMIIHKPVKKLVRQPHKKARRGKMATEQVPTYDPQTCGKSSPSSLAPEQYTHLYFSSFHDSMRCPSIKRNECAI